MKQRKFLARTYVLVFVFLSFFVMRDIAYAAQTTGGVNWLDPLQYQKPQFYPITVPDEATVTNKYWVNMSGGSGSTCSMASPCASIDNVMGKAGTTGGPAYVYVKGTGQWSGFGDTFYGSAGNEIVIKPWPAGSTGCASECSATFTDNSNMNSPGGIHHLIFDGGPNLNLKFASTGTDQFSMHIIASDITMYRVQAYATAGHSQEFSVGDTANVSNVRIINSEFYACNQTSAYQCSAVYWGPGSGGGYTNTEFRNNIVRDTGGDGLEINPRVASSGITLSGNAFHNVGKQTCADVTGFKCRPAITINSQNGQSNPNVTIKNNVMWDIGSGCIWMRSPGSNQVVYNNTCYDYGKISPDTDASPNPAGISGGSVTTVSNNIIYSPNGVNPFDFSPSGSGNLCAPGKSCGTSAQIWNASTLLSTDPNTTNFLQIGSASNAKDTGATIASITNDYANNTRPIGSGYDIGAFEYGTSTPDTIPPTWPTGTTFSANVTSSTSITLTWSAATDDTGISNYTVQRCTGLPVACPDASFASVGTPTTSPFTDTAGLSPNTDYSYRVRASDAAGNTSGWTNTVSAKTQPLATPAITSPLTASGTTNTPFSYQITASNTPTSFSATNLPSWASVNTNTGTISGTPTSAGTVSVTIGATNATGTGTATLVITVTTSPTFTLVDFDTPAPSGSSGSNLNGIFQGINFGTNQWAWEGAYGADPSNHIYFNSATGTNRTFTFSSPQVLESIRVSTGAAGTITVSDGVNPNVTRSITTGSMQTVTTNWTQGGTTITVNFTAGWELLVDDIRFHAPSTETFTPCNTVTTGNFSQSAYNSYGAPFDAFSTSTMLLNAQCTSADPHTINLTTGITGDTTRIVYTKGYYYANSAWNQYAGTCTGALNGEWCQGSVSATITDPNLSTASAGAPAYLVGMTCSVQGGGWKCGCRDTACNNFYWQVQGAGM